MSRRLLTIGILLAILGYGAFPVVFRAYAGAMSWRQRFGREDTIQRARQVARSRGIDVRRWSVSAVTENDANLERYLHDRKQPFEIEYLTAVRSTVLFRGPVVGQSFSLRLNAHGLPTAFLIRKGKIPATAPAPSEGNAGAARIAVEEFLGTAPPMDPTSTTENGAEGISFRWARKSPSYPGLTFTTLCVMKAGTPVEIRADYELDPTFVRDHLPARTGRLGIAALVSSALLLLAASGFSVAAAVRRQIPYRRALALGAFIFFVLLLGNLADASSSMGESFEEPESSIVAVRMVLAVAPFFASLFPSLFACALWAGGNGFSHRQFPASATQFDRLLRGDALSRSVLASIAFGLLAAGIPAATPYVLAALRIGGALPVVGLPGDTLFQPYASLIGGGEWFKVLMTFAFVVPLLAEKVRAGGLARLLGFAIGLLVYVKSSGSPRALYVVLAGILFLFYEQLFRRVDIVAALSAAVGSNFLIHAATCFAQPAPDIHRSGSLMILALTLTTGSAVVGSLTRRQNEELTVDEGMPPATTVVGERQRLQVEFEVARQVQERMIPASPPVIHGFSVASVCRPARQVGGDLYDFLPLADGKWGIAVADVSGKGLPAALYMAMTKGLLLAASDGRSDPVEILSDVNTGLRSGGQRNVFVTAFFGVLDPASQTLHFVRAGHSSTLWRRASRSETVSLTPRGIALGMTSPARFDRFLKVEEVRFAPGDALFIHSDGVTEAMDAGAEEYGDERLHAAIAGTDGLDADAARDLIVRDVARFVGKAPAHDDLTLVVIRALEVNKGD